MKERDPGTAAQRDKLTGLFSREAFFALAGELVRAQAPGYYIMACFNIDKFKMINDRYGTRKGDEVLRHTAQTLRDGFKPHGGVCSRISADNFAVIYPTAFKDTPEIDAIRTRAACEPGLPVPVLFCIGRYIVQDVTMAPAAMYDRAMLAAASIKGRYDVKIALYDDAMRQQLLQEREIVSEMEDALRAGQFEVWFQPQYNHATDAMIGAEALVRWRHPQRGVIAPDAFMQIFERNGFIYALDRFVWEQVCGYLRRWLDSGRTPNPVSVNVSRFDLLQPDVVEVLTGLVQRNALPTQLLRLEITEAAFSTVLYDVVAVVKQLLQHGFTVELDDFGSGYSSLNTLKDVPAQIIKLDMKFLETCEDAQRGGSIVESVVRMAKWLGMTVIAEGVETVEQANYLRSLGCCYMQGYLYAKPMPVGEYEAYCSSGRKERLSPPEAVRTIDAKALWNPQSMDTLIFNSYTGGAGIFEYHNGRMELLRVTQKLAEAIGSSLSINDALRLDWQTLLDAHSRERLRQSIEASSASEKEVTGEYTLLDLPGCPHETFLRTTLRVIAIADERQLVYCSVVNITAQRQAERAANEMSKQLQTLMRDTPGGFARMRVHADCSGCMEYANDALCRMLGMTREELLSIYCSDLLAGVHPDDLATVTAAVTQTFTETGLMNLRYRLRAKNGRYIWVQSFSRLERAGSDEAIINCYYTPLSEREERKLNRRETVSFILSAIMESSENLDFAKDRDFRYVCCSPAFVRFARQKSEADIIGKTDYDLWTKEEADCFRRNDIRLFERGKSLINLNEPIPSDDVVQHYSLTSKHIIRDSAGEIIGLYGSGRDVTDTRAALDRLQLLTDNIPGGIATYSVCEGVVRIAYCNDGFCRLFGSTRQRVIENPELDPFEWVFDEDRAALRVQINELVAHGTPSDCVFRVHIPDGSYRWISEKSVLSERRGDTVFFNAILLDETQRQEITEQLRISEEENSLASRLSGSIVARYSIADRSLSLQADVAKQNGLPQTIYEVPYAPVQEGVIREESKQTYLDFYEQILNGCETATAVYEKLQRGSWRWIEAKSGLIRNNSGKAVKAVISFRDVTQKAERDAIYTKWQQFLQDKQPEAYTLKRCNISKNLSIDTLQGTLPIDFDNDEVSYGAWMRGYVTKHVYSDDRERLLAVLDANALLASFYQGNRVLTIQYRKQLPDNTVRWLKLTVELVKSDYTADVDAYLLFEDIDVSKKQELLIKELSETDPLTGVLNRSTFAERVNQILRTTQPHGGHMLLMLDIDGFKRVNDVFGHAAGDQAIVDIANDVRAAVRHDDLVARLGGDEFLVFLSNLYDRQAAVSKAKQLCAIVRRSFGQGVEISASIGITVTPRDGTDFDILYARTDAALYHVKATGKDNFAFYSERMAEKQPRPTALPMVAAHSRKTAKKGRMLIVDDNAMNNEMLHQIFCGAFVIDKAESGERALELLRCYGSAIAVVLLDLRMPGLNGYEVLEKMQESAELCRIPVIIVSSDDSREACLTAIRKGAADFVTKPVDAELLQLRVDSALSKAENERLRAKNELLESLDEERLRYEVVLENTGLSFMELDQKTGRFTYHPSVARYLPGCYDDRPLWQILLSDEVADEETVQTLRRLTRDVSERMSACVRLKTPGGETHRFRVTACSMNREGKSVGKLLLSFEDLEFAVR